MSTGTSTKASLENERRIFNDLIFCNRLKEAHTFWGQADCTDRETTEAECFLPPSRQCSLGNTRASLGFILSRLGGRNGTFIQACALNSSFKELYNTRSERAQKVILLVCISDTIFNKITITSFFLLPFCVFCIFLIKYLKLKNMKPFPNVLHRVSK